MTIIVNGPKIDDFQWKEIDILSDSLRVTLLVYGRLFFKIFWEFFHMR